MLQILVSAKSWLCASRGVNDLFDTGRPLHGKPSAAGGRTENPNFVQRGRWQETIGAELSERFVSALDGLGAENSPQSENEHDWRCLTATRF